jgi:hypothetical protein
MLKEQQLLLFLIPLVSFDVRTAGGILLKNSTLFHGITTGIVLYTVCDHSKRIGGHFMGMDGLKHSILLHGDEN